MSHDRQIEVTNSLEPSDTDAIAHLIERVTELDGVRPLSEHVMLHLLSQRTRGFQHFCAWQDDKLVGYAALDSSNYATGPSVEVAVDGAARRSGVGGQLLDLALRETDGHLQMWAHGEFAAAGALAASRGFTKIRTLRRMRRSLTKRLPNAPLPDGVEISTMVPDDLPVLVELNARAFVELADQSSWASADFEDRMEQQWFDPNGFLVAKTTDSGVGPGRIVGFHWTKVHQHDGELQSVHEPIGEIYVLAVDPDFTGSGLGRALSVAGLAYLADRGLAEAMLYVDSSNTAAIGLYERLGFVTYDTDVLYESPVPQRPKSSQ